MVILKKSHSTGLKIFYAGIFLLKISLQVSFPLIFYYSEGKTYQPTLMLDKRFAYITVTENQPLT